MTDFYPFQMFRLLSFSLAVVGFLTTAISFCGAQQLPEKQRTLSDRYAQLEQIILRMSEVSASTNPKRAELLRKVLAASKNRLVSPRLDELVRALEQRRLTDAIASQEGIEKDLLELLKLLESENRDQRRQDEKERIKEFLRDLEELIHKEKTLKQRTAQNENATPFEKEQKDVRLLTQSLRDRIENHENPGKKKDDKTSDDKNSDDKKSDDKDAKKPDDKKSDENKAGDEEKMKESAGSEETKPDSDKKQAEPEESEEGKSPTQQAMSRALKRMKQAEKKLKEAEKKGAIEDQEEAIAELQKAKAELEKILRQLREEELMQTLEKLEARFKRMLKVEQGIRTQTEKLSKEGGDGEEVRRTVQIQSSRLGADQQTVVEDADAALVLLREDGTAQAMVESLLQARFDMGEAKTRLDRTELDAITLGIEDAVIASLEEMLDAIDMAIKESKKRQEDQAPSPGGGGDDGEEPLIQMLSELRMIRSMQRRVNERTERYEKMLGQPAADLDSLKNGVDELTRQQHRISRILHDIKVGRTN